MHWAAVIRVSHVGNRDVDSDRFRSVADQESEIRRAIEARGDTVHVLPPELDVSGGVELERRPALYEAVTGVEQGRYGGLVIAYMSRMGRDLRVLLEAWERIENAGGRVFTVREGIDSSTAAGRMQRNLLAAVDAGQREQAAENFEHQRRSSVERGIWKVRQAPRGYVRDPETRKLVPSGQADEIRTLFRDRAARVPVIELARRYGMTASGIRAIVRNRVYLGEVRQGPHVNTEAHPPLISEAEWQAAQTVPRPARRKNGPPALLAGLVRCQSCGHKMTGGSGGSKRRAYLCTRVHSGGECPRPAAITDRLLDEHVMQLATVELHGLVARAAGERAGTRDAEAEFDRATRELDAYLSAVSAADVGATAFAAGARERRAAVERAQQGLTRLTRLVPLGQLDAGDVLENGTVHERNQLLRGLVAVVVVRPAGRGGQALDISERVQVIRAGSDYTVPVKGGGVAMGMHELAVLDSSDPRLLGVPLPSDRD